MHRANRGLGCNLGYLGGDRQATREDAVGKFDALTTQDVDIPALCHAPPAAVVAQNPRS